MHETQAAKERSPQTPRPVGRCLRPLPFFFGMAGLFAGAEALIMVLISFLPPMSLLATSLLDAALLAVVTLPILCLLYFAPLQREAQRRFEAEQAAVAEKEFLDKVIDSLPYPFYVIDAHDYTVRLANTKAMPWAGVSLTTCHALSHHQSFPCSGEEHPCPLQQVKATGKPVVLEHVHRNHAGEPRTYEVHGYPIRDASGEIVQMIEASIDITEGKAMEKALRESEALFRAIATASNDMIHLYDPEGTIRFANPATARLLGHAVETLTGQPVAILIHPDDQEVMRMHLEVIAEGREIPPWELRLLSHSGAVLEVEASGFRLTPAETGGRESLGVIMRDITARKEMENLLHAQRRFTAKLIKYSAVPTFVLDSNHHVLFWNKPCERLTGIKAAEVVGTNTHWRAFYPYQRPCLADLVLNGTGDLGGGLYDFLEHSKVLPHGLHAEGWFPELNGQRRYLVFEAAPIFDDTGGTMAAIETLRDFTDRKEMEEALAFQATRDELTGIYNRRMLDELLKREVERAQRYQTPFSLILFDLDYFKNINDTYGHHVGDAVLRTVAAVMGSAVRTTDHLGRWGGEEFMLLAPETVLAQASFLAEKLRRQVEGHHFDQVHSITMSIGVGEYRAGEGMDSLVKRVDDALYRAKESGRNTVEMAE